MAHRTYVMFSAKCVAAIAAGVLMLVGGCSEAGPASDNRGRVIDQDTGLPIAGAIVVGKYMGSRGFESASSCDRVESAISDRDGWFTLPLDAHGKMPFMEAYHRGYAWGRSVRSAQRNVDGNMYHWQVVVCKWDAQNTTCPIVRIEPTIYQSEADALNASREWKDVYLKASSGSRDQRLVELHRMQAAGSCASPHQTSAGPGPYFEAILEEEIELADDPRRLQITREYISEAFSAKARAGDQK